MSSQPFFFFICGALLAHSGFFCRSGDKFHMIYELRPSNSSRRRKTIFFASLRRAMSFRFCISCFFPPRDGRPMLPLIRFVCLLIRERWQDEEVRESEDDWAGKKLIKMYLRVIPLGLELQPAKKRKTPPPTRGHHFGAKGLKFISFFHKFAFFLHVKDPSWRPFCFWCHFSSLFRLPISWLFRGGARKGFFFSETTFAPSRPVTQFLLQFSGSSCQCQIRERITEFNVHENLSLQLGNSNLMSRASS